jgi:hypothetical protein
MKLDRIILLAVLSIIVLCGCQANGTNDDDLETWEKRPFYGELRFLIEGEDTGAPIPGALLQVSDLPIVELRDEESISSGQDGRIVIHQMERGTTYWGKGQPPPAFTFSAPHYHTRTYSVEDLVSGTAYDAYRSDDLPTTTFQNKAGAESELPVYEFTIRLEPSD